MSGNELQACTLAQNIDENATNKQQPSKKTTAKARPTKTQRENAIVYNVVNAQPVTKQMTPLFFAHPALKLINNLNVVFCDFACIICAELPSIAKLLIRLKFVYDCRCVRFQSELPR